MDLSVLTVIALLMLLGIVIYATRSQEAASSKEAKTDIQKRSELMASYKLQLETALKPVAADRERYLAKKRELLKTFSIELSRNIYFDNEAMKEAIRELASYDVDG